MERSALGKCRSREPRGTKPKVYARTRISVLANCQLKSGAKGCRSVMNDAENVQAEATAVRWQNSFNRLCVAQMSLHSEVTLNRPLKRNLRIPRTSLICPKTGSTVDFRRA